MALLFTQVAFGAPFSITATESTWEQGTDIGLLLEVDRGVTPRDIVIRVQDPKGGDVLFVTKSDVEKVTETLYKYSFTVDKEWNEGDYLLLGEIREGSSYVPQTRTYVVTVIRPKITTTLLRWEYRIRDILSYLKEIVLGA